MIVAIEANVKLLTVSEAAEKLRLSVETVRKYIQRGLIIPERTYGRMHFLTERECERYNREKRPPGNPSFSAPKKRRRR